MPRWNVSELVFFFLFAWGVFGERWKRQARRKQRQRDKKNNKKQVADLQSGFKLSDGFQKVMSLEWISTAEKQAEMASEELGRGGEGGWGVAG